MIPLQCGTATHTLLALYDPPDAGAYGSGIVLCNPWGQEHIRAYGTMRFLAKRLQKAGHHVLRFDYYGCGDSGGDFTDASVDQWCQDTMMVVEELKTLSGVSTVTLLGARLGAVVASLVAAERPDIDRLVLWDPIIDTASYVAEMVEQSRADGVDVPAEWPHGDDDRLVDVDGSPVTREMGVCIAQASIDISTWRSIRSVLLIASNQPLAGYASLARLSAEQELEFAALEHPWPYAWSAEGDFETRAIPLDAIDAIVENQP